MCAKLNRLIILAVLLLPINTSSFAALSGPCAKECTIRASLGNRLVKGPASEVSKAVDLFADIGMDHAKACMDGCVNETSAAGCRACAKRVVSDKMLADYKNKLAPYACPTPAPKDPPCVAALQPTFDYSRSPTQEKQKVEEQKKKYAEQIPEIKKKLAKEEADKYAKKSADLLAQSQKIYEQADAAPFPQKTFLFASAEKTMTEALGNKLHDALYRDYAEGRPFNPGKNYCVPACNSRLPINGMGITGVQGLHDEAKVVIPAIAKKAVMECVISCAGKSNEACGACATEQITPEIQVNLANHIKSNYGCGVTPGGPPPTTAHIAGQTILDVIGISGVDPGCPKLSYSGVIVGFQPQDPEKSITVQQVK